MILPVRPGDAHTIAHHRFPAEADTAERPIYAEWVKEATQRGLYLGFLALNGQKVVSGAGLTLLEWGPSRGDPQPWRGRIVNVWTHPDHRRQGLARELVEFCVDAARERRITRLNLGTSVEARHLYETLGFTASTTEMTIPLC
ncbi:N-acetyltransferase domain-containing protein [Deinococcus saxicola]|uniref:GNAT family N-acetyltransferase n=1 Tax=Deinococcus saxicola TaxID=249406 RepID=UPI0039F0D441